MIWTLTLPILGYLLGSIPTGVLLGRVVGRDPRRAGSGNIGASNVTRSLGVRWGAVTLLVDAGKGLLAAWLGLRLAGVEVGALAGGLAVVGHCFPVWLRFRGGKGVATSFGALAVFAPGVVTVTALIWIAFLVFTRIPALGSLASAALFVVLARYDHQPFAVQLLTLGLFGLIVARHTSNLRVLKARYLKQAQRRKNRSTKRRKRR